MSFDPHRHDDSEKKRQKEDGEQRFTRAKKVPIKSAQAEALNNVAVHVTGGTESPQNIEYDSNGDIVFPSDYLKKKRLDLKV